MCYGCCCLLAAAVLAPVLSLSHPCVAEVWLSRRADVLQTLAVPRLSCICWEQGREIFLRSLQCLRGNTIRTWMGCRVLLLEALLPAVTRGCLWVAGSGELPMPSTSCAALL